MTDISNSKAPLISVIVPIYNDCERPLDQCLESIVNQTYKNLEIILIDDGSTDQSAEKIADWAKRDDRIVTFYQENQGVSAARNTALDMAHGEYITFVDSDDFVDYTMYESMLKPLIENECDLAICTRTNTHPDGTPIQEDLPTSVWQKVFFTKDLDFAMFHSPYDLSTIWNKIYHRRVFDTIRFPRGVRFPQDMYIMPDTWRVVRKAVYINQGFYHYRLSTQSVSFALDTQMLQERLVATARVWDFVMKESQQNIPFLFNLYFGAFVSAFQDSPKADAPDFLNQYKQFFRQNLKVCLRSPKAILFLLSPRGFLKLRSMRNINPTHTSRYKRG